MREHPYRPTRLDEIKNFRDQVRSGSVSSLVLPSQTEAYYERLLLGRAFNSC